MRAGIIVNLSRPLAVGLFVAVLTAGGIAHSEPESVSVEPARSMYAPGETAEFTITNSSGASIFIPGCGALQLQYFESENYIPIAGETCVSEGVSVEIAPGAHTLSFSPDGNRAGQILRVGISYGAGCEAGRELSQSRCGSFKTAYSGSFRVGRGSGGE